VNLRELLDDAAVELPDVTVSRSADGSMAWARGNQPFAVLSADGMAAEFALDVPVAAAATRTPDATASSRGAGWVTFRARTLDAHAIDRARAWFESAHRRLARG
jgi:hypothetical protein